MNINIYIIVLGTTVHNDYFCLCAYELLLECLTESKMCWGLRLGPLYTSQESHLLYFCTIYPVLPNLHLYKPLYCNETFKIIFKNKIKFRTGAIDQCAKSIFCILFWKTSLESQHHMVPQTQ